MRKPVGPALLFLASLAVALGIGELMVRALAPHSRDHVVPAGLFRIDRKLGWTLNPGVRVRHRTKYFDVEYSVNEAGFRDGRRAIDVIDGRRRILFFGDSEIFGWGVDTSGRASNLLGRGLPGWEILNLAAPGYGLDQQVLSYERIGPANPGATIVLLVSTATIRRTLSSRLYRKSKPQFVLDSAGRLARIPVTGDAGRMTQLAYRAASALYLPYFVELQWLRFKGSGPFGGPGAVPGPVAASTLPLQKALLLEAKRIAQRGNHRLAALVQVDAAASAEFRDFCAANGILFVDTRWHATPAGLAFGKDDPHWGPGAHARVAALLLDHLREPVANDVQ